MENQELKQGLIDTLQDGKARIIEQAPDICREIMLRGIVTNTIILCVALGLILIYSLGIYSMAKNAHLNQQSFFDYIDKDTGRLAFVLFGGSVILISIISSFVALLNLLSWMIAPKVKLIEALISLTNRL